MESNTITKRVFIREPDEFDLECIVGVTCEALILLAGNVYALKIGTVTATGATVGFKPNKENSIYPAGQIRQLRYFEYKPI